MGSFEDDAGGGGGTSKEALEIENQQLKAELAAMRETMAKQL